jgi:membrane-associated protease RseP (regulator of RpoE activity)
MNDRPRPKYLLNLVLFVATVLSTTLQGALDAQGPFAHRLVEGLAFSMPLMAILVSHEFGHYFAARAHGVPASLPYFIPFPVIGLLGTMGAVITQEATSDRKKLIDIGAAGPLAGVVVAIPVLWYGLAHSPVQPLVGFGYQEGNSIGYALLKRAITGAWLPGGGRDVMIGPVAKAGWGGLLVTMLNLIPIGQLDGGHVATAYFGNRYARAARVLHRTLPALAAAIFVFLFAFARRALIGHTSPTAPSAFEVAVQPALFWLTWAGLLMLMKRMAGGVYHPPVDDRPLPRSRRVLFWVVCVTFLLTFMPVPLRISIGQADISRRAVPTAAP